MTIEDRTNYIAFLSIGNPSIRARVFTESANNLSQLFEKLHKQATKLVRKHLDPAWIKIDFVHTVEKIPFQQLEEKIAKTRRNYFRHGIAFDPEFRLALLEQELNGNAILRSVNKGPVEINDKNMIHYLDYRFGNMRLPFTKNQYLNQNVHIFKTKAAFLDREEGEIKDLYDGQLSNGIRKIEDIATEAKNLIRHAANFLEKQVDDDGKFTYGYFSAFAKSINTYNILRHSSTLYSMAEAYEHLQDEKIIQAVKRGIEHLIREAVVYKSDDSAFVVDYANEKEIKLGSNATAILAITKYTEVTGDDQYIKTAQALARGILELKTPSGGFMQSQSSLPALTLALARSPSRR